MIEKPTAAHTANDVLILAWAIAELVTSLRAGTQNTGVFFEAQDIPS